MKIVYTAPNYAHHFIYARAINQAGHLTAFISGFPRISRKSKNQQFNGKIIHADWLQTLYILGLKSKLPMYFSEQLCLLAKLEQDNFSKKYFDNANLFLFYSGCGLNSCREAKKRGLITIVEAVNSHVDFQEEILRDEALSNNLKWRPFEPKDKSRRLQEYEEADYILVPSEFVKTSFINKGFPLEKILKVPYGFHKLRNKTIQTSKLKISKTLIILYVGSISIRKGIKYLIEAFKDIKHPNKILKIVGPNMKDGALEGIQLEPNIYIVGVLKGKDLEKAYRTADIFCLPTLEEGLALVLGEALSFGLPIVATTNSGAEDLFLDGQEGFIVPTKNSKAITEKIQLLIDNPELLSKMKQNALAKSENINGWDATSENLISTLWKVFSNKE